MFRKIPDGTITEPRLDQVKDEEKKIAAAIDSLSQSEQEQLQKQLFARCNAMLEQNKDLASAASVRYHQRVLDRTIFPEASLAQALKKFYEGLIKSAKKVSGFFKAFDRCHVKAQHYKTAVIEAKQAKKEKAVERKEEKENSALDELPDIHTEAAPRLRVSISKLLNAEKARMKGKYGIEDEKDKKGDSEDIQIAKKRIREIERIAQIAFPQASRLRRQLSNSHHSLLNITRYARTYSMLRSIES